MLQRRRAIPLTADQFRKGVDDTVAVLPTMSDII